mgnify:FL=1
MDYISDFTLLKQKYDIEVLERNLEKLDKKILLATQVLTADFCIKYIWDPETDSGSEDSYIYDFNYILDFQPHLTEDDLIKLVYNSY